MSFYVRVAGVLIIDHKKKLYMTHILKGTFCAHFILLNIRIKDTRSLTIPTRALQLQW